MTSTVERLEKSTVRINVEIPAEDFEKAVQTAYYKERGRYTIQGFRKGHAPRKLIERFYGEDVFYEGAIEELWRGALEEAVKEHNLDTVGRPSISIEQVKLGEPLKMSYIIAVYPEVKLGQYKGLEIEDEKIEVTEEQVQNELELARNERIRWAEVAREVQNTDRVVIDFKGKVDDSYFEGGSAEDYTLEIGSGRFIPGFEEQLIGLPQNEWREITVVFPEDYHAEEMKGKKAVFEVMVKEVREKEMPEIDDDLAKDASEFDTLEEWKQDIRKKLEMFAQDQAKNDKRNSALLAAAKNAELEIPDAMIDIQLDGMLRDFNNRLAYQGLNLEEYVKLTGQTLDDIRNTMRPDAEMRVRNQLVLDQIRKEEGIEATEEEIDRKIAELAAMYNKSKEEYEKGLQDFERKYIAEDIAIEKTLDMMVENAILIKREKPAKKPAAKKPAAKTSAEKKDNTKQKPAPGAAKKPRAKKDEAKPND